ncbi:hypothetical protein NECAME_06465 [Necator americanus]|uniref:RNA-dependent RNA polymerase n=1 Tax=Necator americanus TaxID=51031 RepID=W2TTB3_NECAM|nr:hypothetical protein NECAME_06465 [Necator americanus]ETN85305.1 hypothetical protein NECAME_06465 [Necator americanus]
MALSHPNSWRRFRKCDAKHYIGDICNGIARKCAIAVDFPKSGEPAEPLTVHEQSDIVPDYMFSVIKPMYRSHRLNGQIYRKAKKVEEVLDMTELTKSVFEHDVDQVLCPPGFDPFRGDEFKQAQVRRIRDEYAAKMQQLLDEYGVSDEASIVSGHIEFGGEATVYQRDPSGKATLRCDENMELKALQCSAPLAGNSDLAAMF